MPCKCPNVCWSILWFFVLILIAWPISFLLAVVYLILAVFSVCCPALQPLTDGISKSMMFPVMCTKNMIAGNQMC
uniref:Hypotheticial protein n=1 Tax=Schistosoma japonicum TaxID=6182 RepID=C1LL39_SCHJA|nr:hypotheticial protein [Schistosoma japonicum]CAX75416.1 hypotheticial protein [Schistosoma japonicum]CAX75417.1 hypotheticial protein [Schistosoma japonicum]CAX75418.1 hypotheticial protein [Schistosoma japonicum]